MSIVCRRVRVCSRCVLVLACMCYLLYQARAFRCSCCSKKMTLSVRHKILGFTEYSTGMGSIKGARKRAPKCNRFNPSIHSLVAKSRVFAQLTLFSLLGLIPRFITSLPPPPPSVLFRPACLYIVSSC
ncbi:hypothetical protein H4582DRAFT_1434397 [Lactarius indigo]|nr:hypothetical protein H4582DRAFT_1434397 [Lactarius indigo]